MNTILILLVSTVFAVFLFRLLKLPTILGYLLVGILLKLFDVDTLITEQNYKKLPEFGIVFLMFSIGLEFSLSQLYAMRHIVIGIGGLQVIVTTLITILFCSFAGLSLGSGFLIGIALSMSSTAIVSKLLIENLIFNARHGRISIGILLFQDIAVVLFLVIIPIIGHPQPIDIKQVSYALLEIAFILSMIFFFGKKVMNLWLTIVTRQKSRELFVLNILMMTLGLSFLADSMGLSYTLGAFLCGMLIAETHFRYQVESDIAPFRDILLGLFFITLGILIDPVMWVANLWVILSLGILIIFGKAIVTAGLVYIFKYESGVAIRTGVTLAQAGEFSFVFLSLGLQQQIINNELFQVLLGGSLLSIIVTPFLIEHSLQIAEFFSRTYTQNRKKQVATIHASTKDLKNHVIICGYGRSGQYTARFLREEKIPFIAIDIDPHRVQEAGNAGEKVVYGDASRRVILSAAGADRAKLMIISYNNPSATFKILYTVKETFPKLPVIVRTTDETQIEPFQKAGAKEVVPEILEGSLMLASQALVLMGVPVNRIIKRIRNFREMHYKTFRGFFHGFSDAEDDLMRSSPRLHSLPVYNTSFCLGKSLKDIYFGNCSAEIIALRRNNESIEIKDDVVFDEGDVIVLLATPEEFVSVERILLVGKGR